MATRDRRRYAAAGGSTTVAVTGNTDEYVISPVSGILTEALFSGTDALATSNTNYVTFTITNLGPLGTGTRSMLAAVDGNTTRATGGAALVADTRRALTINSTAANLRVSVGDRIRIRAAVTGTLANTVTGAAWLLVFNREL